MYLGVPSIGFVYVLYVGSYLIIKAFQSGSQVYAILILCLCVILHTMWSGSSMQLICILFLLAVCMLLGMVVRAEADSVSSVNCVHSIFL